MCERSVEELNEIATAITCTMYELAAAKGITHADLASAIIVAAGNVGFSAWKEGVVEQLRNAADVFERQMISQ